MSLRCSHDIKAEALRLGFSACGMARANAVDEATAAGFRQWLQQGHQAEMHYMENHLDKRLDPRLLMDGLKTIVCVALNYTPSQLLPHGEYQLAAYALGQDYHDIVKQKLHKLAAFILNPAGDEHGTPNENAEAEPRETTDTKAETSTETAGNYRVFSDSAPILERYWAVQAGLGWIGRNHQLIIPPSAHGKQPQNASGSMFFLGELFLDIEPDEYDKTMPNRCGTCRKCMDACPTGALGNTQEGSPAPHFASMKCLSYQTIENRGDIPHSIAAKMGDTIYGCDRCQQACPWNRFAIPTDEPLLQPKEELLGMTREKWHQLSEEDYRKLFKGSAVKRAKYSGLMRNIHAVSADSFTLGNEQDE